MIAVSLSVCPFFRLERELSEGRDYATFILHPSPSPAVAPKMLMNAGCMKQHRRETSLARAEHLGREIGGHRVGQGYKGCQADLLRGGPA